MKKQNLSFSAHVLYVVQQVSDGLLHERGWLAACAHKPDQYGVISTPQSPCSASSPIAHCIRKLPVARSIGPTSCEWPELRTEEIGMCKVGLILLPVSCILPSQTHQLHATGALLRYVKLCKIPFKKMASHIDMVTFRVPRESSVKAFCYSRGWVRQTFEKQL